MAEVKNEKILILVKTYPHKSAKYKEIVCTAGIKEDGSWVRIFPVPYRLYGDDKRYSKYQWVDCAYYKAKDPRPESYHIDIDNPNSIKVGLKIGTDDNWEYRRRAILDKVKVYTRFSELKKLSDSNEGSLAVFHPTAVKLHVEKARMESDEKQGEAESEVSQPDFFQAVEWGTNFKHVAPVPYDFKYEITDADGQTATHKIIDWELGTLFFGEKKRLGTEEKAKQSVIKQYGQKFLNKDDVDLYLYMGTMLQFQQRRMPNPWTIIGVAQFPRVSVRPVDLFSV